MTKIPQLALCVLGVFQTVASSSLSKDPSSFDQWQHLRVPINEELSLHARYAGNGPPVLLVHGNPQHSLSWHTIGPILAQNYTVIAPDNRGMGDSSVPRDDNYTAAAQADDLKAILDSLNITCAYAFSHDKGSGITAAFAAKYPSAVKRVGFSEYALPGFGYEALWVPNSGGGIGWDLYKNWQLAFFSVPDAAEFFISGRVKEMLAWYFFHTSYSGNEAISQDHLERYTTSISKPGFLRSMLNIFSVLTADQDDKFFTGVLAAQKLQMPTLVLGGEASAPGPVLKMAWTPVAEDLTVEVVPKAGHWILDENPAWVAKRLASFFGEDQNPLTTLNLDWLTDKVTLQ